MSIVTEVRGDPAAEAASLARSRRLESSALSLARLRNASSVAELVDGICAEAVTGGGFGRVVLSRATDSSWTPHLFHAIGDDVSQWFPQWAGAPIPIGRRTPELKALTTRRSVLVADTQHEAVHRPIIVDAGRARSYVVAPLICQNVVVGLLHADHRSDGPLVDEVDRDILWSFASGVGFLYERAMLQEALHGQRQRARAILLDAADSILTSVDQEAALTPGGGLPTSRARVLDDLTPRETEVLRLMADGCTNHAIAERLLISPDTVKSHVKHVLRKLGASNRAQAVSYILGV